MTPRLLCSPMRSTKPSKNASVHAGSESRSGQPTSAREPSAHSSPAGSRADKRILLVDDDPTVRDSLGNVLEGEGYFVIPAENGQQALDFANKLPVDLALLDLNMPVMNGWDTFWQLTGEHPLIPVIIATARPNQLFAAVGAGVGALLEKPMDIPTLLLTIKRLLAESVETRLERLAGLKTDFHYSAARM